MADAQLSIIIPARNEEWLRETCADVLAASSELTKVLVVLDEDWPQAGRAPDPHPRLDVIRVPKSRGQRGATNLGIRVARTPYVMKLDAHCAMAKGFDAELVQTAKTLGPDVIQIPLQYNFHVFNRVCSACQHTEDMGPTWPNCPSCKAAGTMTKQLVWKRRMGRRTSGWMFDKDLHFQYWGEWGDRQTEEVHDVMSCLGACWFVNREWYWSVDGLDEAHGSWGQMGTELACKAWLSGGRMVCNKRTWFAHMFRTQGGDFSFPYPLSGKEVSAARAYSRKLWLEGGWPKATRSIGWLLEKFQPFPTPTPRNPSWTAADLAPYLPKKSASSAQTKGIVWYSDAFGRGNVQFQDIVRASWDQLAIAAPGIPVVAVVLGGQDVRPRTGATIIHMDEPRGYLTMFRQILTGLEALDTEIAYLCEHDVLYAPEHFAVGPVHPDRPTYNQHVWKVSAEDGRALHYLCSQTSGLSCNRQVLVDHYRRRIAIIEQRIADGEAKPFQRSMGFEPGTRQTRHGGVDDMEHDIVFTTRPNVDVRHDSNLTPSRWRKTEFRNQRFTRGWTEGDTVPGWGTTRGRFAQWLQEVVNNTQA